MTGIIRTKGAASPATCHSLCLCACHAPRTQHGSLSMLRKEKKRGGERGVNTFKILYLIFVKSGRDVSWGGLCNPPFAFEVQPDSGGADSYG